VRIENKTIRPGTWSEALHKTASHDFSNCRERKTRQVGPRTRQHAVIATSARTADPGPKYKWWQHSRQRRRPQRYGTYPANNWTYPEDCLRHRHQRISFQSRSCSTAAHRRCIAPAASLPYRHRHPQKQGEHPGTPAGHPTVQTPTSSGSLPDRGLVVWCIVASLLPPHPSGPGPPGSSSAPRFLTLTILSEPDSCNLSTPVRSSGRSRLCGNTPAASARSQNQ